MPTYFVVLDAILVVHHKMCKLANYLIYSHVMHFYECSFCTLRFIDVDELFYEDSKWKTLSSGSVYIFKPKILISSPNIKKNWYHFILVITTSFIHCTTASGCKSFDAKYNVAPLVYALKNVTPIHFFYTLQKSNA